MENIPTALFFKDTRFEELIRDTLNKPAGNITGKDMEKIETLDGSNHGICDISGIEYCVNLKVLDLSVSTGSQSKGEISDITQLGKLINLVEVDLSNNLISNINVLSKLVNLKILKLNANPISDISALSGLVNLTELDLCTSTTIGPKGADGVTRKKVSINGCSASDLAILSEYNGKEDNKYNNLMEKLALNSVFISDINALSGLTNLKALRLLGNTINDVTPLAGLCNLELLIVYGNPISDYSSVAHIKQLFHD